MVHEKNAEIADRGSVITLHFAQLRASLEFRVVAAEVLEVHHEQLTAGELCQVNAYRKARLVAKRFPDTLVETTFSASPLPVMIRPGFHTRRAARESKTSLNCRTSWRQLRMTWASIF